MKFLLVPPFGLGDVLSMLPLAYNLKKFFPACEVHFLCSKYNNSTEVLKSCKYVDKVIILNLKNYSLKEVIKFILFDLLKLKKKINLEKYDFIFNLKPNLLRRLILTSKKRIDGEKNIKNQYLSSLEFLNIFGKNKLFIPKNLISYKKSFEIKVLKKFNLINDEYVILNFFGSSKNRSLNDYSKILEQLDRKKKFVIIGKTNKNVIFPERFVNLINLTDINELVVLIKNSKLVVTVDSGPMHLAIILNKPIIGIFKVIHSNFIKPTGLNYHYFFPVDLLPDNNSFKDVKNNEKINIKLSKKYAKIIGFKIREFLINENA